VKSNGTRHELVPTFGETAMLRALVFPLCLITPAFAHDFHAKPACQMTYDEAVGLGHAVVEANADATFSDYSGAEAEKIVGTLNAVEPVSHWIADHVIVIDAADGGVIRVGVVSNDCLIHALPVPRDIWPAIVSQALGDRS
jgi:hypothetical protein